MDEKYRETRDKLESYGKIVKEISDCEERIKRLEAKLCASPKFDSSGIPKNPTPQNSTERAYIEILSEKEKLRKRKIECYVTKMEIEKYIEDIPSPTTRLIFKKRIFERKPFFKIAMEMDTDRGEDSVRKRFTRYIEKCPLE